MNSCHRQWIAAADERFDSKIRKTDGCWEWTGQLYPHGYGQFRVGRQRRGANSYAHRYAFVRANGPIPEGRMVLHHCDNKRCVRPDHLYLGDAKDNARDLFERHGTRNCKLTADDKAAILAVPDERSVVLAARYGVTAVTIWALRRRNGQVPWPTRIDARRKSAAQQAAESEAA